MNLRRSQDEDPRAPDLFAQRTLLGTEIGQNASGSFVRLEPALASFVSMPLEHGSRAEAEGRGPPTGMSARPRLPAKPNTRRQPTLDASQCRDPAVTMPSRMPVSACDSGLLPA